MTRWRAEYKEKYYYVDEFAESNCDIDLRHATDKRRYEAGNYFMTKFEAEAEAVKIRNILNEHHDKEGGGE